MAVNMTCPKLKRKFEEVEQAVHSCVETLTGYEKCLLQNKLLLARSRMVNYENLALMYEAHVSMAKLEVEIATSDVDLLLQELKRGKRFKTGEAITTISTSTQTNSQSTFSSPTKSVYDTSRISFELPSIALQSFTRQRSDNGQEPSTSQGENAQESTTSQAENAQDSTASQCSRDSGHNWSPKCLASQEIQGDLSSVNTREGDTEVVKNTKKCKPKKASDTKDKSETSKKFTNEKLTSTKEKIKTKDKATNEKTAKVNQEVHSINETTQKIDNTRKKSVQRRQSQDNRHRKRDERKSDSHDRRNSAESQNKTTDQCNSLKNMPKHREQTKERKSTKEKCETFDEKQISNRNNENIKPKTRHTSRSQNIRPSDDDKSDKIHQDIRHKEADRKSEPAQKSNLNRRENTDLRIKNNEAIKAKNESDKVKYESKKSEDTSCDTTLVIPSIVEVETTLPKRRTEHFKPFEIPYDSPIHYTDFANTILSSVAVADASDINVGGLNTQNTIAQSTPFVRRITTVEHSGSECQDLPPNVLCSDPLVEDKLTTFIRTALADYNKDAAEPNITHTITVKETKTNEKNTIRDKTTKINDEDTCKNTANVENIKVNNKTTNKNEENACKSDRKPKTSKKMIKSNSKQNLMVKIPVTRVPDAISHINPTVFKIPVTRMTETMNQRTTTGKQPCLTVTVNDAGVITIRPRSVDKSNPPSPILEKTVVETHKQNTQEISVHSTTASDSKEPIIRAAKQINGSTSKTPVKITTQNTKHLEMPNETASYMTQVKDQYYFDVDSPRLADEAPTHKNAVSLFRAFSLLMPPSPTFTVSSSSDKENCKSTIPLPPRVKKLPINKNLLDDFVPGTFHSNRNYITTGFKNDIHTSHRNDISTSHRNDIPTSHRNDINTNNRNYINPNHRDDFNACYKNDINTSHINHMNSSQRNDINSSQRNDIHNSHINDTHTSHRNYINISQRNDINTSHKNDINTSQRNKNIVNNMYNDTKPRRASITDIIPRRTIKFTDAQPLPVRKTKSTPKPKTNRRKSLDDRAILRIINEPCSSLSSKSGSPKSKNPTPKKKGLSLIDYFAAHDIAGLPDKDLLNLNLMHCR